MFYTQGTKFQLSFYMIFLLDGDKLRLAEAFVIGRKWSNFKHGALFKKTEWPPAVTLGKERSSTATNMTFHDHKHIKVDTLICKTYKILWKRFPIYIKPLFWILGKSSQKPGSGWWLTQTDQLYGDLPMAHSKQDKAMRVATLPKVSSKSTIRLDENKVKSFPGKCD